MPEDGRRIVEAGYDEIAERYARALGGSRGPRTYFRRFLDRVLTLIPEIEDEGETPLWVIATA